MLSVVFRAPSSSVSHVVQHVKHQINGEDRARFFHRVTTREADTWQQVFGSNDATTIGWNQQHGRSTVMPLSPIGGLRCSDCHSNGGLVVSSAAQLGLDTVGITARFCVTPRHNGAVFLHCGEGEHIADDVLDTALQLGLHGI